MDQFQKANCHYAPSWTQGLARVAETIGQCAVLASGATAGQKSRADLNHSVLGYRGREDYYQRIVGVVASLLMCLSAFGQFIPHWIIISGQGEAKPYPAQIRVGPNLLGATFRVQVLLPVFDHNAPANLDILLVERGDDGSTNAVVLMSGGGGTSAVSGLQLTFDDSGAILPTNSFTTGTYQPANYTKGLILPSPAPTNGIWSSSLSSAFVGNNPNGIWQLYVNDRVAGDLGEISGYNGDGWQLFLQTGPTITGTPTSITMPENGTNTFDFTIGDEVGDVTNLWVVATSTNSLLLPPRNVTITFGPPLNQDHNQNVTAIVVPTPLQSGNTALTLTVNRGDGSAASSTIPITVNPVNAPKMLGVSVAGGTVQVSFAGTSGSQYKVQRSTDLVHWSVLATIQMPDAGSYTYPDTDPPASAAYYRSAGSQ